MTFTVITPTVIAHLTTYRQSSLDSVISVFKCTFDVKAHERTRVVGGSTPTEYSQYVSLTFDVMPAPDYRPFAYLPVIPERHPLAVSIKATAATYAALMTCIGELRKGLRVSFDVAQPVQHGWKMIAHVEQICAPKLQRSKVIAFE